MCAQKTVRMNETANHLICRAALTSRDLFGKAAEKEGLTLTLSRLAALMSLSETPISMKDCSNAASIDRSTISQILWRLHEGGLVVVRNASNGHIMRACEIAITSKGEEIRDKGVNLLDRLDAALLEEVGSPEEQEVFLDQLDRLVQYHAEQKELRSQRQ